MKKSELQKTNDRREYKLQTTIEKDPYLEECWSAHNRRRLTSIAGSKNKLRWNRKNIFQFQYRAYRTWKYNRKTKWK